MKLQSFSREITLYRKLRGLTIPELAHKARVPKSGLWKIETNPKANPTITTLRKISRALGIDVRALLH